MIPSTELEIFAVYLLANGMITHNFQYIEFPVTSPQQIAELLGTCVQLLRTLQGSHNSQDRDIIDIIADHPRSRVVYNFGRVCMSVRRQLSKALTWKFIFAHAVYLQGIRVKFIYEGHWVKVKVTGAKNVENPYRGVA